MIDHLKKVGFNIHLGNQIYNQFYSLNNTIGSLLIVL